ncbi:hypothetical protein Hanom_Chr06g00552051 [Helianthus anomalus]
MFRRRCWCCTKTPCRPNLWSRLWRQRKLVVDRRLVKLEVRPPLMKRKWK